MFNQAMVVFQKELKDNFRDKRNIFMALLHGPVILPIIFTLIFIFTIGNTQTVSDFNQIYVVGDTSNEIVDRTFTRFGIRVLSAPKEFQKSIENGDLKMVAEFVSPDQLGGGEWRIHYNASKPDSLQHLNHFYRHLFRISNNENPDGAYSNNVAEIDLSVSSLTNTFLRSFFPFILFFSMMTCGFAFVTDVTTAEKEAGVMESLLSLPVSRIQLVLGKLFGLGFFIFLAGVVSLTFTAAVMLFISESGLYASLKPDWTAFFTISLIIIPFGLTISCLLLFVASLAKNTKEAQNYLGILMFIPLIIVLSINFFNIATKPFVQFLPLLNNFYFANSVVESTISVSTIVLLTFVTLLVSILLYSLSLRSYQEEALLNQI